MIKPAAFLPFRVRHAIALAAAVLLASACATQQPQAVADPSRFLHDEVFPGSEGHAVESPGEVFALDQASRSYLDEKIGHVRDLHARNEALIDEIIAQAARKLEYESAANTTASQTFHNQTANCLSMSILTFAMADYLGYEADFQAVDIPEYWERRRGHNLVARHVNVLVSPHSGPGALTFSRSLLIDFFAPGSAHRFNSRVIPRSRVLAMYYNNKGVDALFDNNHDLAYAYLRAALLTDPGLDMTISNLGMLYKLNGRAHWAEENYREAIRMNPDSTVSAEGLASVLEATGRASEAAEIRAELEDQRENNPYYQYVRGEEAYEAGDWQQAIRLFGKAIELRPDLDPPYFGLAKTYFRLGDNDLAEVYLRRAERHADAASTKTRYRNKIAALSGL